VDRRQLARGILSGCLGCNLACLDPAKCAGERLRGFALSLLKLLVVRSGTRHAGTRQKSSLVGEIYHFGVSVQLKQSDSCDAGSSHEQF